MKKEFNAWTDVAVNENGGKIEFNVWGRKYTFENSFLPTSVTSLGQELLSKPIAIEATFKGESRGWEGFQYTITEKSDEKAVMIASCYSGNIVACATVTVEFDGFVKVEMNISSEWSFGKNPKAELDGLYMDIPLADSTKYFHYWPNNKSSITPAADIMNSGAISDMKLPFKPCLWAGDEQVGLNIFPGESDKNFQCGNECITVSNKNIRITLLDSTPEQWLGKYDLWNETLNPLTYTFGFHATPVKEFKYDENYYKRFHLYNVPKHNIYDEPVAERAAAAGVKWIILHEDWTFVQNYGLAQYENKFKLFIDKCHKLGMKVMLYTGYEYSTIAPHWNENCEKYLNKTVNGNYTGGWQRSIPHQRAFMACYKGGYTEEFFKRIEYIMDEYGADGIYNDGGYIPWECANESHGCGYRDKDGLLHITYPVLAVREFTKRFYETVHKRGGIIDAHQSSCCTMQTLSFCDSYYDGENIQRMLTDKDMSFLNLDAFRAEYMGINFGLPTNFLSYTSADRTVAGLSSLSLLHNVHIRVNNFENLEFVSDIWRIFDELNLDSAKWHPYWDNSFTWVDEENAYTSVYEREKDIVIYAADFEGGREITINVPKGVNGIVDFNSKAKYHAENGKVKVALEQSRPYFFTVE